MKDIRQKLLSLLKKGYCTPKISLLAKKLAIGSTTIHYNIKKLEQDGVIRGYKAILDYEKAGIGFTSYILVNLLPSEYDDPEKISRKIAKFEEIESVDIVTGQYEIVLKVRTRDMAEYYEFVKSLLKIKGIAKIISLNSMKEIKSDFTTIEKEKNG